MSLFVYVHKCNIVSHYNIKYFWFFISRVLRHSTKPNFFFVCLFQFRLLVHSVTVKALIKKKDNRSIHPMRLPKRMWGCSSLCCHRGIWDPQAQFLPLWLREEQTLLCCVDTVKMSSRTDRSCNLFLHRPSFCSPRIPPALPEPRHFYSRIILKTIPGCRNLYFFISKSCCQMSPLISVCFLNKIC